MTETFEDFNRKFDEEWAAMDKALRASEAWQRIELKKVYITDQLSQESTCFAASVYKDGKCIGEAQNRGEGGSTDVFITEEEVNWIDSTIPTMVFLEAPWQKVEALVDAKLSDWILQKEAKKILKKMTVIMPDGRVMQWPMPTAVFRKKPEREKDAFLHQVMNSHPGANFLFLAPEDEALRYMVEHLRKN